MTLGLVSFGNNRKVFVKLHCTQRDVPYHPINVHCVRTVQDTKTLPKICEKNAKFANFVTSYKILGK